LKSLDIEINTFFRKFRQLRYIHERHTF